MSFRIPPGMASHMARAEIRDVGMLCRQFGLRAGLDELKWGVCECWDGVYHCATDGMILWRSIEMATMLQRLGYEELPTFGLSAIMGLSVGMEGGLDALPKAYRPIVLSKRVEVREAIGSRGKWLYLTDFKNAQTKDELSFAVGAVCLS